jgi:hypothetical protein
MPSSRIADSIVADIKPSRKIDRIRGIWGELEKLRQARLTCKQIVEQLPKYGIEDISYDEFNAICHRIRKRLPAVDRGSATGAPHVSNRDFDPIADAKRRLDEKTKPIFGQRKEN